jgi:hypothetical protein
MNCEQTIDRFRYEQRSIAFGGETLEALPEVTRRSSTDGELNLVSAFSISESNFDEVIDSQIEHYRLKGKEFEWKVYSFDEPNDLQERLERRGFSVGDREALVFYDLSAGVDELNQGLKLEVRQVCSEADLVDFRLVAESVFGKDYSLTTRHLAEALASGDTGHIAFVGYAGAVPVSIGRLYSDPQSQFGGLYGGGTLAAYRGMGFYRAVIAARAMVARSFGVRYLQVDALPTSLPILLRLGFVDCADTWPCSLSPI